MRTLFGEKTSEIETWRLRRTIEGTSVRDRGTSPVRNEPATHCATTAQRPHIDSVDAAHSRRHSNVHRTIVRNDAAIGLCTSKADISHTLRRKAQR